MWSLPQALVGQEGQEALPYPETLWDQVHPASTKEMIRTFDMENGHRFFFRYKSAINSVVTEIVQCQAGVNLTVCITEVVCWSGVDLDHIILNSLSIALLSFINMSRKEKDTI